VVDLLRKSGEKGLTVGSVQLLFSDDFRGRFIGAQSKEDRLRKLIVAGPLGKLDLGDQDRFDPMATFHDRRGDTLAPSVPSFLWQIGKRTHRTPDFLQEIMDAR
jgi:hypothetical protein